MVRSLKNNTRKCDICGKKTVHDLCLNCQRGIDNVRGYRERQEVPLPVRKPVHPNWLSPRIIRT